MNKLQWTAIIGLGTGFAALGLTAAAGLGNVLPDALADIDGHGSCAGDNVKDTGATERHWAWDGGNSVEISVAANVHYRAGEGTEVIARGPASALADITVDGDQIRSTCNHSFRPRKIEITLPGREYHSVRLRGSGDVTMEKLAQPALELRIDGSGGVRAQGAVDQLTTRINGSGDVHLKELTVKQLEVKINGSGNAEASASERADVTIAGSGDVHLLNHPPSVQSQIRGSGRIIQD